MRTDELKKAMHSEKEMDAFLETQSGDEVIAAIQLLIEECGSAQETLRDKFAGQSLIASTIIEANFPTYSETGKEPTYKGVAERAYILADAMLLARKGATK